MVVLVHMLTELVTMVSLMMIFECRTVQEVYQDLMHTRPDCHLMRYMLHDFHDTCETVFAKSSCWANAMNVDS